MLKIKNLNFSYNKSMHVLKNISGEFYQGNIIALVGENGSGKSTFLKTTAAIIENYTGDIFLKSKNILEYKKKERAKLISYVPQIFHIPFPYKVKDLLDMGKYPYANLFRVNTEYDVKVDEIVNDFEITDKLELEFNKLSGGEQQRILLARALIQNAEIIFLDEPGSFLDIRHTLSLMDYLLKLKAENKLIFMVTHDINLASLYSDMVILLKNGGFYKTGTPEEVLTFQNIKAVFGAELYYTLYPGTKKPVVAPLRFKIENNK